MLIEGVAQAIAGTFHVGQWFCAVPSAVIKGMLPGIGVLIFASQFHVMLDAKPIGNALKDIVSIPSSIPKAFARNCFAAREQREFRLQHLGIAGELRHEQGEIRDPVVDLLPREHLIDY